MLYALQLRYLQFLGIARHILHNTVEKEIQFWGFLGFPLFFIFDYLYR